MKPHLELIKTMDIFLVEGVESSDIVLEGDEDGDIHFSFILKYTKEGTPTRTYLQVTDVFHAKITIETRPSALTSLTSPMDIGTYQNKALFMDIRVQPCIANGEHNITISLYKNNQR